MRTNFGAIALLAIMASTVGAADQESLTLDLAAPPMRKQLEAITGACGGGRTGWGSFHNPRPKPELPLKLEIVALNGTDLKFDSMGHSFRDSLWSQAQVRVAKDGRKHGTSRGDLS